MLDAAAAPEAATGVAALFASNHGLSNGVRASADASSREPSMPTKTINRLTLATTAASSDDEDDHGDDDDLDADADAEAQRAAARGPPGLPSGALPTGLCYDPRMRFHAELDPPKDRSDFHPEDPRRIFWIYRALCEAGLAEDRTLGFPVVVPQPLRRIPVRHATRDEVLQVHTEDHFMFVKETASE